MSKSNATGRYGDETLSHSTMIHQIKQINEAQKTVDELSKELAELSAKDRKLATMSYAEAEAEIHRMAAEHRRLIRECEVMKESSNAQAVVESSQLQTSASQRVLAEYDAAGTGGATLDDGALAVKQGDAAAVKQAEDGEEDVEETAS